MPTDDHDRLRAVVDEIVNALQPAVFVAAQLRRASAATAEDTAIVDDALTRVVQILKTVQKEPSE